MITTYERMMKFLILSGMLLCLTEVSRCHSHTTDKNHENKCSEAMVDLLDIAENALHKVKLYATGRSRSIVDFSSEQPMDCAEIYKKKPSVKSGIHTIWPRSRIAKGPISVFCDREDDGGAWTVIQRRGDFNNSKDYFYRDWLSYKSGFGHLTKDFWLGNNNIFALTNQRSNSIKFTLSDWEGNVTYAMYDDFWIDDEEHNYMAHVARYTGTAGDSFSFTNDVPFSTKDKDNDKHSSSCAISYKGAWWYASCHSSNLNGYYLKGAHESYADGVEWSAFRGQKYSLKDVVIKIRPKDFKSTTEFEITPQ